MKFNLKKVAQVVVIALIAISVFISIKKNSRVNLRSSATLSRHPKQVRQRMFRSRRKSRQRLPRRTRTAVTVLRRTSHSTFTHMANCPETLLQNLKLKNAAGKQIHTVCPTSHRGAALAEIAFRTERISCPTKKVATGQNAISITMAARIAGPSALFSRATV